MSTTRYGITTVVCSVYLGMACASLALHEGAEHKANQQGQHIVTVFEMFVWFFVGGTQNSKCEERRLQNRDNCTNHLTMVVKPVRQKSKCDKLARYVMRYPTGH